MQTIKKSYEQEEMRVSCVLCGDLNSTEDSGVCELIKGRLNTEDFTRFNFSRQMKSTRPGAALSETISGLPMNLRENENSPIFSHDLGLEASVTNDELKKVYTQTAGANGLVVDHIFTIGHFILQLKQNLIFFQQFMWTISHWHRNFWVSKIMESRKKLQLFVYEK